MEKQVIAKSILFGTNQRGAGATFDWLFFDNSKLTDFNN
jgi:hypothetical protein